MTTTVLSPLAVQGFQINGVPAVGAKLFTYAAGTTTKLATYVDQSGTTPNTNPVILNSRGEANIWIPPSTAYKFTFSPSTDTDPPTAPIWTVDQISAGGGVTTIGFGTTGLTPSAATGGVVTVAGTLAVANGGTGQTAAGIASFNAITGYTASGATGTTSGNLVFDTSPTITGATLTTGTVLNGDSTTNTTGTIAAASVGYRGIPQNAQTGAYVLALADAGQHISNTTGGVTIPANASVAFPIGTAIVIYNDSGSNQTIAITSDNLLQAGTANTGSRTLAQRGVASLLKIKSTTWVISGAGVS